MNAGIDRGRTASVKKPDGKQRKEDLNRKGEL